jgi:thioredoxin 1
MSTVTITESNFKTEVLESQVPVLLDFWAPWCGPCRMVGPVLEEIAAETQSVKIGKVNVDENPGLAAQFGVMSIPTLIVFKGGAVANKSVGALPKEKILQML